MSKLNEKMSKIKNDRIIPAIILSLFFGGLFCFTIIGGNANGNFGTVSRIISYIIFSLLFVYVSFELFKSFKLAWYISLFLAFASATAFALPFSLISQYIDYSLDPDNKFSMINVVTFLFEDYLSVLILLAVSIFYFFYQTFTIENRNIKNIFIKSLVLFIALYILLISSKQLIYSSVFAWQYFILFIAVSICADVAGFFGGKFFGHKIFRKKLAPNISPKKTWEGAITAFILTSILIVSVVVSLNLYNGNIAVQTIVSLTLPIFAILGDLTFSAIKRMNLTKDFSKLLLGHGGILDRYDSISFTFFFGFLMLLAI
ncbi:phosphatidate cytidylyltransferase [Mycoplasmopsis alligatoris]|uniref:Phosphatidate cytidylyltransferase n=1 Tax=Mycoplasmopsis alligatoris A21JP2 TaxID=747682 RepID=D4XWE9_9BACT|nr:phosphatidate cytidylyltransferase [Mycoplasmopsis alligatoris]EFF41197.1 phosphatidate cytidylyltransferase [Mycoplasmopsis alligatoris A21JP2]